MPPSLDDHADRERAWIMAIAAGDEAAFDAVFSAYYGRLCRYAAGILGNHDAAEDVVQRVFVAIWNFRDRWEIRRTLRLYLYTAVRNSAVQELRKRQTRHRLEERHLQTGAATGPQSESFAPDVGLQQTELFEALERAISALPPRGQQAYRLHRDHGLTYEEIGDLLGISPKTVSVHIGRALVALRHAMARHLAPIVVGAVLSLR